MAKVSRWRERFSVGFRRIARSVQNGNADDWKDLNPHAVRLAASTYLLSLKLRNCLARTSVVEEGGPVVSLTSYGSRLDRVYLSIESIAAGELRPGRILLWIAHDDSTHQLNAGLQRLRRRGLEILYTPDYGPHKKYYPFCASLPPDADCLVTADDDVIYARWWLKELLQAFLYHGAEIAVGYRVRRIRHSDGVIAPYLDWPPARSTLPDELGIINGVSGAVYPRSLLQEARRRGDTFLSEAFSADDLWLTKLAMDAGVPRAQVFDKSAHFWSVPGTQAKTLTSINVGQRRNDVIARAQFTPAILADKPWVEP